jgi:hypothetical protein
MRSLMTRADRRVSQDRPGAAHNGVKEKRFKSGEQWDVLTREEGVFIIGKDGIEKQLPLDQAQEFSVFERKETTLSIGDRVRFAKNVKHHYAGFCANRKTEINADRRHKPRLALASQVLMHVAILKLVIDSKLK